MDRLKSWQTGRVSSNCIIELCRQQDMIIHWWNMCVLCEIVTKGKDKRKKKQWKRKFSLEIVYKQAKGHQLSYLICGKTKLNVIIHFVAIKSKIVFMGFLFFSVLVCFWREGRVFFQFFFYLLQVRGEKERKNDTSQWKQKCTCVMLIMQNYLRRKSGGVTVSELFGFCFFFFFGILNTSGSSRRREQKWLSTNSCFLFYMVFFPVHSFFQSFTMNSHGNIVKKKKFFNGKKTPHRLFFLCFYLYF